MGDICICRSFFPSPIGNRIRRRPDTDPQCRSHEAQNLSHFFLRRTEMLGTYAENPLQPLRPTASAPAPRQWPANSTALPYDQLDRDDAILGVESLGCRHRQLFTEQL